MPAGRVSIGDEHLDEIKALVESGDVDLKERRDRFKEIKGRTPNLDDEGLMRAISATVDDDDDLFVKNVEAIEAALVAPQNEDAAEAADREEIDDDEDDEEENEGRATDRD